MLSGVTCDLPGIMFSTPNVLLLTEDSSQKVSCETRLLHFNNGKKGGNYKWLLYEELANRGHFFVVELHSYAYYLWRGTPSDVDQKGVVWKRLWMPKLNSMTRLCDLLVGPGMTVFGSKQEGTVDFLARGLLPLHVHTVPMGVVRLCNHHTQKHVWVSNATSKHIANYKDICQECSSLSLTDMEACRP